MYFYTKYFLLLLDVPEVNIHLIKRKSWKKPSKSGKEKLKKKTELRVTNTQWEVTEGEDIALECIARANPPEYKITFLLNVSF